MWCDMWQGAVSYTHLDVYKRQTFNRAGFQSMIADVETGNVKRVIVKDMSRLGRDYLQVGMYTEIFFPEHDVHFIAVNDGVDSNQEDNEFTPFRNIINEWYAKDTVSYTHLDVYKRQAFWDKGKQRGSMTF